MIIKSKKKQIKKKMNFVNYPHPYKMPSLNTQSIQKQLNENNKLIKDAYIQQCSENYDKAFE